MAPQGAGRTRKSYPRDALHDGGWDYRGRPYEEGAGYVVFDCLFS
jgi:hypothetical protein